MKQRIALLGSTGSIGVQTLDIVRENSELFEITTLTAHRNWEALARQAEEVIEVYRKTDPNVELSVWREEDGWVCIAGQRHA